MLKNVEPTEEAYRSLMMLRNKSNEIAANAATFSKAPAPIDFDSYKKKLKFTSSAVDALEVRFFF